jgi:hypothetical protein
MMSTITNQGTLRFMLFTKRFTAPRVIEFLQRLVRSEEEKVFLILDQHPVHKSKPVKRWLAAHADQVEVYFLPGYSPELNPDDYLNQDIKSNAVGRQRPPDQQTMMSQVRTDLQSTQKLPQIVRHYFRHPDVTYAAAQRRSLFYDPSNTYEDSLHEEKYPQSNSAGIIWHEPKRTPRRMPSWFHRLLLFRNSEKLSRFTPDNKTQALGEVQVGDTSRFRVKVAGDKATCFVDGKQVWQGKWFERDEIYLENLRLGLGGHFWYKGTTLRFAEVQLRMLTK